MTHDWLVRVTSKDAGRNKSLLSDLSTLWKHDPSNETKLIFKIGLKIDLDVLT